MAALRTACVGTTKQDRLRARRGGQVVRDGDAVVQAHAGQKQTLALVFQIGRVGGVMLPQHDVAAGARASQRQRRSPGAATDHRDVVESHVFVMLREGGASSTLCGNYLGCALATNPAITGSSACADDDSAGYLNAYAQTL